MAKKIAKTDRFLVIVESPTKAKKITKILDEAGYKSIVMATKGHIMKLADKRGSYKNTGVYPNQDFELNLQIDEDHYQTVQSLKEQAARVDKIYLMTDPDREGFVIAWSLVKFLKLKEGTYVRAITHEITPKAVINAIENPVDINLNLVDAGLIRLIIDKCIGYGLTPEAKAYLGARSVGRCQSVGNKVVVDREKEIQNFIPETYFDLYLHFKKNDIPFRAEYLEGRIKDKYEVVKIKDNCIDDYKIEDIVKREKQESPKPPFCTATLQQEASNKLGLGVKDTMSIAQKLFEGGFISYHRTDDTALAPDFLPELEAYNKATFGSYVLPRVGKKTGDEQEGHEAIRITDPNLTPDAFSATNANTLQVKLYKLIWQRTIASALPNAIISETKYIINNNNNKFVLISNELISAGYRQVYDTDSKDEPYIKETFEVDEKLENCLLEDVKKETQPPARFTQASLVQKLKELGVGRPATYATIVEIIINPNRGYATVENNKIIPTERGIQLADYLDRAFPNLINLNYTRELEEELDKVAKGEITKLEVLKEFYNTLETAINNNKEKLSVKESTDICPECGGQLVIRRSRFGKLFKGCSNYPNCRHIENMD